MLTATSVSRGSCTWCGDAVLVDQERVKDGAGKYLHRPCARMRHRSQTRARMRASSVDGGVLTLAALYAGLGLFDRFDRFDRFAHSPQRHAVPTLAMGRAFLRVRVRRVRADCVLAVQNLFHFILPDNVSRPDELLLAVLTHLPKPELLHCGAVCSLFRRVSADPRLWKTADFSGRILSPRTLEVLGKRSPVAADFGRSSGYNDFDIN